MTARRDYSRHGLNVLKAKVKVRGLGAIDRRTAAARALLGWRQELIADLGGPEAVSAQQMAIVELCARARLYVDSLDAWLFEQPTLISKRRKAVLPVLRERTQIADSLAKYLGQLGLFRRRPPELTLADYLKRAESQPHAHNATLAGRSGPEGGVASPKVPASQEATTEPTEAHVLSE